MSKILNAGKGVEQESSIKIRRTQFSLDVTALTEKETLILEITVVITLRSPSQEMTRINNAKQAVPTKPN